MDDLTRAPLRKRVKEALAAFASAADNPALVEAVLALYDIGYLTCRAEALYAAIHMTKAGSIAAIRELEP